MFLYFLHPINIFWFSRLPETDLSRAMDEKEAVDECNVTAEKEEGVSILFLPFDLVLLSDIFSELQQV